MITTVRLDDYNYFITENHWRPVGERKVCTTRPDREDRFYYEHRDFKYMMVVVQAPGGLVALVDRPVLCLVQGFGGENPAWTFGELPGAPPYWRDGYIKVSMFQARKPEDAAQAEGTLITTLDAIWRKALGPTTVLLRQHGLIPLLEAEPDLSERAHTWWETLRESWQRFKGAF